MSETNSNICPACASPVEGDRVSCEGCCAVHHRGCFDFHEGCAIIGCGSDRELANSPAEREAIEKELRHGIATARRLWFTLALAAVGFIATFFFFVFSIAAVAVQVGWLTPPVDRVLMPASLLLSMVLLLLFLVQGVYALILQRRLEQRTGSSFQAPVLMPSEICDHLELLPCEQWLVDIGDRLAALTVLIAFLTLVFARSYIKALALPWHYTTVVVLLGLGLPWLALSLAREQLFFVQTIENRCHGTFEQAESASTDEAAPSSE